MTVHAAGCTGDAAEDVAAANDDADLDAVVVDDLDLLGKMIDDLGVDAVAALPHEGLTGELEQHALVLIVRQGILPFLLVSLFVKILAERRRVTPI